MSVLSCLGSSALSLNLLPAAELAPSDGQAEVVLGRATSGALYLTDLLRLGKNDRGCFLKRYVCVQLNLPPRMHGPSPF